MTQDDVYAALQQIFADVFLRDDIKLTPATSARDVAGWDSYKQIEIVIACEEQYEVKFTTRELDALKTVGDLVSLILARTKR
jgi:acyl carrier protein